MSVRFAGSRSVDSRRRRRIAVEKDSLVTVRQLPATKLAPESNARQVGPSRIDLPASPKSTADRSTPGFVSPHVWKHLFIGCCLLLAGLGCIFASVYQAQLGLLGGLLANDGSLLWRYYCSSMLFLTAQLSLLNWWVRSRSPADFDGKYTVWMWITGGWFLFAAAAATDAHLILSRSITWLMGIQFYQHQTLNWLVPSSILGCVLSSLAHKELVRDPVSRLAFYAGILGFIGSAMSGIVGPLTSIISMLVGLTGSFLSMSLYARYVIYVSSDPPQR